MLQLPDTTSIFQISLAFLGCTSWSYILAAMQRHHSAETHLLFSRETFVLLFWTTPQIWSQIASCLHRTHQDQGCVSHPALTPEAPPALCQYLQIVFRSYKDWVLYCASLEGMQWRLTDGTLIIRRPLWGLFWRTTQHLGHSKSNM